MDESVDESIPSPPSLNSRELSDVGRQLFVDCYQPTQPAPAAPSTARDLRAAAALRRLGGGGGGGGGGGAAVPSSLAPAAAARRVRGGLEAALPPEVKDQEASSSPPPGPKNLSPPPTQNPTLGGMGKQMSTAAQAAFDTYAQTHASLAAQAQVARALQLASQATAQGVISQEEKADVQSRLSMGEAPRDITSLLHEKLGLASKQIKPKKVVSKSTSDQANRSSSSNIHGFSGPVTRNSSAGGTGRRGFGANIKGYKDYGLCRPKSGG